MQLLHTYLGRAQRADACGPVVRSSLCMYILSRIYCIPNVDRPLTLELGCRCGRAASDRTALTPLGLADSGALSACILQCANWLVDLQRRNDGTILKPV